MPDTVSMYVRPTVDSDLDTILAMAGSDENTPFVRQWSREKHLEAIADKNIGHFVIQAADDKRVIGYIILIGLENIDKALAAIGEYLTVHAKG